jgi:hypothetical protein
MPMVGKKKFSYTKAGKKKAKKHTLKKRYEDEIERKILMLTAKQKTLPPALKKKILASKMKNVQKEKWQKKVVSIKQVTIQSRVLEKDYSKE